MNGSARGALLFESEGRWRSMERTAQLSYVCEAESGQFCGFGMVEGLWGQCYDVRLDERSDVMNWFSAKGECEKYGMSMMRIANKEKDEWLNSWLWDTGLFAKPDNVVGMWIGASETSNSSSEFAWTDGTIIGAQDPESNSAFDSSSSKNHYNSKNQECLYLAPCDASEWRNCNPVTGEGQRWLNDKCENEGGIEHFFGCQIPVGQMLNLTNIFHPKQFCPEAGSCGPGTATWWVTAS